MKKVSLTIYLPLFLSLLPAWPANVYPSGENVPGTAQILRIQGVIGPAASDYVRKGFETARTREAALIVMEIDTPGGLASSMREIIHTILNAPFPVVAFVYPPGSRAASAGTYILYASHIAAMAPGTNLGAATPIRIGGGGVPLPGGKESPPDEKKPSPSEEQSPGDPMKAKMVNDAAAYIRSLAEMRGRNADWAERSVRQGASLPVNEALELNVIDVVAADIETLLDKIDGRKIALPHGQIILRSAGLTPQTIEPDWRNRLLSILTNPNIAFILMLIGIYGIIFEFTTPGTYGPGVIGVICLLVGLYALHILPLNYAGLALLLLSLALMAAEAFVPSFGVLGIGGLIAFVLAAFLLFDSDIPGLRISWTVIAVTAVVSGGLMIFLLSFVWRAHRRQVTTGSEGLLGKKAEVLSWSQDHGYVRLVGERWKAHGDIDAAPGDQVVVTGLKGLVLEVDKREEK